MAIRPATLIDSCVLLDVITGDKQWADWSAAQLAAAVDTGRAVINPLIYAEVSVGYQTIEEIEELLPSDAYEREQLPYLAGFAAEGRPRRDSRVTSARGHLFALPGQIPETAKFREQ